MVHMEAWLNKVDDIAAEGHPTSWGTTALTLADGEEFVYRPPAAPTFHIVDEMLQITYEEEVVPE